MKAGTSHEYQAHVIWTGNRGAGTADYASYGREHRIVIAGKPDLAGSATPAFRGSPDLHNPEDLFVSAIASCHMLAYLALCARHGVRVLSYRSEARGTLELKPQGGGRFTVVRLAVDVAIADDSDAELARTLDDTAHERCFIASSCNVPIVRELRVTTDAAIPGGVA